jgi:multicomponent Na+:H+ antiporter subunit D
VFREAPAGLYTLLLAQAICTMIVGLIGALAQRDFRRILSFNLVGHLGYTTVGLALTTPAAMAASILYMLHHICVITNLYLVSGIFLRLRRTTDLAALGSLYRARPLVAVLAMIPVFSLAGVPPLSGFIGKLVLVRATFDAGAYWTGAVILLVGVLTLVSMARLWDESFWKPAPHEDKAPLRWPALIPIAFLSAVTVAMTCAAEPLFWLVWRASEQLLHPGPYIDVVLKGGPSQ